MNARLSTVLAQANDLPQLDNDGLGAGAIVGSLLGIAFTLVLIAGNWNMYEKAGKPGWGSLIPIYMWVLLLEIAGKPIWWIVLFITPAIFVIWFLIHLAVARNFGKSTGFGIAMAFFPFIFYAILGFGDARYRGATT